MDLEEFLKPVIASKNPRIQETELISEFSKKCYKNEQDQEYFLKYIQSYLSTQTLNNILITHVAGDGKCLIYAFIAFLKEIGTFTLSCNLVGFTQDDMNDNDKKKQYTEIINQYIEEQCAYYRDESINYYNNTLITKYPYLPIIDDNTNVCSPHVLLYLSIIYSTVIVIIHYQDGVDSPTIINSSIEEINDYCFILCKSAHGYGLHIPNKNNRKNIYEHIINTYSCTFL